MILLFIILSIFLEALTDALNYLSWTKGLNGVWHHVSQIFLILSVFFIGYFYKKELNNKFRTILLLLIAYILIRIGFFDLIYQSLTNTDVGNTSLWDKLIRNIPIFQNTLFRLLIAFTGIAFYIIKIKNNEHTNPFSK